MLSFISNSFLKFQTFMANWSVWQIVAFAVAIPVVAIIIQLAIDFGGLIYVGANFRLNKFLKSYSYLSSSSVFAFNRKVVKGFPRHIRRQTKHIADSGLPMEEYLNTFNFCPQSDRRSIVGGVAIAHIVLLGIVVAMNGFSVGIVSASILATLALWLFAIAVDFLVYKAVAFVNGKFKRKFIIKLDLNTVYDEKSVDLTLPKEEVVEDSALQLANTVQEFLESKPDKGIAKVVLKGIYSAKFSSAMTAQSRLQLKNVVEELKNYVG